MLQNDYKALLDFIADCCEEVEADETLRDDGQDDEIALGFSSVFDDR